MWSQATATQQRLPTMALGRSCTNAIRGQLLHNNGNPWISLLCKWVPIMGPLVPLLRETRQTGMDGHVRCSFLTLQREEHLKSISFAYKYRVFLKWIHISETLHQHATCPGIGDVGYQRSVVRIYFSSYHFWMAITTIGIVSHICYF
jgi:hypothetical protein